MQESLLFGQKNNTKVMSKEGGVGERKMNKKEKEKETDRNEKNMTQEGKGRKMVERRKEGKEREGGKKKEQGRKKGKERGRKDWRRGEREKDRETEGERGMKEIEIKKKAWCKILQRGLITGKISERNLYLVLSYLPCFLIYWASSYPLSNILGVHKLSF